VHKEHYILAEVELEMSLREINFLSYDSDLILSKRKVFLRTLVNGEKSLFMHKDPLGQENFFIKIENDYQLLIYKKYLKIIDQKEVITENNKYIGQLLVYLDNCPSVQAQGNKISYNSISLTKTFKKYYNNDKNTPPSYIYNREKDIYVFGVLLGGSISHISFQYPSGHLMRSDFPKSKDLSFGAFLEITFNKTQGKISFNNEISYTQFETRNSYEDRTVIEQVEIATKHINLNNMLRYKQAIGAFNVFGNLGITNAFLIDHTNILIVENKFNGKIKYTKALDSMRNWEIGYQIGLGLLWKSFSIEYRYQNSNWMTAVVDLAQKSNRHLFYLGFRF